MNTLAICEAIKTLIKPKTTKLLNGLTVVTPIETDALTSPYVLIECTGDNELIPRNKTWECSVTVTLKTSAHDHSKEASINASNKLVDIIEERVTKQSIEQMNLSFLLYTLQRRDGYDITTDSGEFIQSTSFRAVVQF